MAFVHVRKSVIAVLVASAVPLFGNPVLAADATSPRFATKTLAHLNRANAGLELAAGYPVQVTLALQLRNKDQLDAITQSILAGNPTKTLSSAEVVARFAPSDAQIQKVVQHLRDSGFVNIKLSPNRLLISADGSHGTVKAAFHTSLHQVSRKDGTSAYINTDNVTVPASIGNLVVSVLGLQTLNQAKVHYRLANTAVLPDQLSTKVATTGHSPTEFSALYNASKLASASTTVVGIIAEGSLTQTLSDLKKFTTSAGYAAVSTRVVTVGSGSSDTDGVGEWNLDSQTIVGAAGGAVKQLVFYTADSMSNADITSAINKATSENTAKVVNVSLGECEQSAASDGMVSAVDQILQIAVAQGQVFSVSTGDSGSDECGDGGTKQSYPAVSPYVIAVGGTTLRSSGTTYSSESAWSSGGGGSSTTETAQSWQYPVLGTSRKRGVPDIAFDGDPNSGALIYVNGSRQQIGGTSLSAPIFTGFWARLQAANSQSLAYPVAGFYKYLGSKTGLVHDVISGKNGAYSAKAGWDYASGWGSFNVGNLATFIASNPAAF